MPNKRIVKPLKITKWDKKEETKSEETLKKMNNRALRYLASIR